MARAALIQDADAPPEADRLEGFPHPRDTVRLIGHADAERTLADAIAGGKMHHAWLITGPAGIGKATLAYRMARAALADAGSRDMFGASLDVSADASASRLIAARAHPGLLVLARGYDSKAKRFATTISVDDVRRLRSFLGLSAEAQGWRVVIVDSADEMNINAANALLKSLEEPPPQTLFLLISAAPGRLLATIRSRCRTLALNALSSADLRAAVTAALAAAEKPAITDDAFRQLEPLANGSPRRLLGILEGGGLALQTRIDAIFQALPTLDIRAAHALADELQPAAQEQKFELFFDLFFDHLARLIRTGANGTGPAGDQAASARLIGAGKLATFAQLWETLARDKATAQSLNLDRKALVLDCLTRLEAAARS
ncbi:MAG: DNA polymerase III subunit delta' [Hyphomicrobium sp.]